MHLEDTAPPGRGRERVGGEGAEVAADLARSQGRVMPIGDVPGPGAALPFRSALFPPKRVRGSMTGGPADLERDLERVAEGAIRSMPDQVLPPGGAAAAHRRLAEARISDGIAHDPGRAEERT